MKPPQVRVRRELPPDAQRLVRVCRTSAIVLFALALVIALEAPAALALDPSNAALAITSGNQFLTLSFMVFGVGVICILVGAFVHIGDKNKATVLVIGIVLSTFAGMAIIYQMTTPPVDGQLCPDGTPPPCIGPGAQWEIYLTVPAAGHDAATEYPGNSYTFCSAITPAGTALVYTGTITGYLDRQNRKVTHHHTITSTLATTAAAFSAPDCNAFDFSVRLLNGQDRNGDGVIDAQNYFGQILSISRTTTTDGNSSVASNVFYSDVNNGFYVGWFTDGSNWVSAYPGMESMTTLTTGPSPIVNIGSHGGGAADVPAFWYLLRNYGPFGYTQPPIGTSIIIQAQIGSPGGWLPFTVEIRLNART